jgi:cellulose synthase/poly-beta-1,6-N-acetylglucosamine synthase-like glycosyltransferase
MITTLFTSLYILSASLLALYTCGHGLLLWQYWRGRTHTQAPPASDTRPTVTVQLPIYNEQHVAVRLLDAVARFDYPPAKLHIQLLDDSTDITTHVLRARIRQYPHLQIDHLRRPTRTGYKAGALAYGVARTTSQYIAIFDADFIPPPDFLQRTIPHLQADARLCVVQTRWGHLNPTDNWLTRAQVLSIDTHFIIEQAGRYHGGYPVPFNGTGGVWRRQAIDDAGGWSHATLTEDLDLSMRAQLRGWRSLYLPQIVVAGELPPQLAAYRQQQARWAQGSSQNLRRLIGRVWQSDWGLLAKVMASQHLAQYVPHVLMLLLLLLTPPLLLMDALHSLPLAPLGIIGLIPPLLYVISQRAQGGNWGARLLAFPALLLIGTGLIWSNSRAVVRGLWRSGGEFRRTPKFVDRWQGSKYALGIDAVLLQELALMGYALWGAWLASQHEPALTPYLLLHALSCATVALWDMIDQWRIARARPTSTSMIESGND